jgi:RNA polymerase sigma-70 factor (ECF subfamily)
VSYRLPSPVRNPSRQLAYRGAQPSSAFALAFDDAEPSLRFRSADGATLSVLTLHVEGGAIRSLANQLNPEKLQHLAPVGDLFALLRDGDAWPRT